MQKILTVTINLEKLQAASEQDANHSFVREIPEVNALLEEGWIIEEWDTLGTNSNNVTLLFILNDELDEYNNSLMDEYEFEEGPEEE
ncbi:hypothetical protein KTO58_02640 [Chitinophaga pendula]|uniref:hypothetical protein n=1 Tax=Chitinophaga TaxID=79328 RepID=UPI000BAFA7F8|nr:MULTISPECIES: hypothetical protein [Chitinophaga]ASZ14259.1 hypothetical protein CK934_26580 [Chitinophaga sp. MD30]UCJ08097.1 hypothetical protein KTO58_02640 [Chitinophaga pendula]